MSEKFKEFYDKSYEGIPFFQLFSEGLVPIAEFENYKLIYDFIQVIKLTNEKE